MSGFAGKMTVKRMTSPGRRIGKKRYLLRRNGESNINFLGERKTE